MFNGYNDSALISYEFNQEREKKLDNVPKYSYGHDGGVQSTPTHPNNRRSEFWPGKPNFVGIPNVVKCNCTGCYPTTENQSYQVQSTRHRPWLPKTYSVPLNGSNECKLPAYQWDNALNHVYYSDSNVSYGQENGGKHSYYRQFQTPNQPGVIISANKQRSEMGFQNGVRQPVMCNQGYDLTKRVNGRSYYDEDKYSIGAHSVNQIPRLPVEPYTKAVPSNLNQNRVPSTGLRKENSPQCDHYTGTKIFPESYYPGLSPMDLKNNGIHVDYSYFNRDPDPSYRNNYIELKRNNAAKQARKDCSATQVNIEQHYGRTKHADNLKGCETYPNFEKNQMESCIQRIESDGINRITRSVTVCNDLRYSGERPQVFPYQNNADCRNYVRPEYPQFNSQWIPGFQETDQNQCRTLPHQFQSCDQQSQGTNGCIVDPLKSNSDKTQSYGRTQLIVDAQAKPNYIETIRSEELTKNGTNKISPLRLLRKKKLAAAPQEPSSTTTTSETSMLDVRKFWSTWAEEEDENISSTQMVVLDCQNIDPEQAKLLNFYETDPSRPINLEHVLKSPDRAKGNTENVKASEQPIGEQEKQGGIPSQIEPVVKNAAEVMPNLEAVKISPKKYRSHELRKKKKEEVMDKWTEKKFDFLKKSEESKAAEMIRYEEEKKKIFERRLSFQQIGVSNIEKPQEDVLRLEENSQRNSPKERIPDLPTSEYRRNKFLDYSEVIVNGCKDSQKIEDMVEQSTKTSVKKEEPDIKQDADSSLEMNDILKKITEINFEEMKLESGLETSKKTKKTKEKKSEQLETDTKTGLKLETVSKPTIKFSIQKSHDLKISFKVLNKKYEEEVQRIKYEETKPVEDINTELITLKYKSIQNGGKLSDSKKKKGKLWRKKLTPALKIKKSRYSEEERDPLAEDDETKTYPVDDFQVQETVDSAKIKLTFKRHKTNLETEYKIDSEGLDVGYEDKRNSKIIENKHKKKSKKAKKHKIYIPSDIDSSHLEQKSKETHSGTLCGSEDIHKNVFESAEDYSEKSHLSYSTSEEETHGNLTTPLGMTLPEKQLYELTVQTRVTEESRCEIDAEEQLDLIVNSDEARGLNDKYKLSPEKYVEEAISKSCENGKTKEENQGISLDFIRTINSQDIGTNRETEKTEEIEGRDVKGGSDTNGGQIIESTNVNHSILESSYDLKKNVDCVEIKSDLRPISLDERDADLKSDSDNVSAEVTGKDNILCENLSKKWLIDSENIYRQTNSECNLSSKLVEDNFEEYVSLKEKIGDFEPAICKNDESEVPEVVHGESKIELGGTFIKIMDSGRLENHLQCPEVDDKDKPEKVHIKCDKLSDKKHSELSEMKTSSPLLLNEDTHQPETYHCIRLSESSQSDKWVEPDMVIIKEKEIIIDDLKLLEENSGFKSQSVDSQKLEIEESQTSVGNETKAGGFIDDEGKTFLIESEFDNCISHEKQHKLYESRAVNIHDSEFPFENLTGHVESELIKFDGISSGKSDESGTEGVRDSSITEQQEPKCIDINDSHLLNKNCDENKTEEKSLHLKNVNQKPELINLENIPRNSDFNYLIHIPSHMNEEAADIVTGEEMEIICVSQNSPSNESETQFPNSLQTAEYVKGTEEVNSDDINEIVESEIEFDLSNCDSQIDKNFSQIEPKDSSQFLKGKAQPTDLPEATHFTLTLFDNVQGTNIPETCNREPHNFIFGGSTRIDDVTWDKNKFKQVSYFEDDKKSLTQADYLEKQDEEDKELETFFLNDKLALLVKPQKNIIVMENKNQPEFSGCASPINHSPVNSLTDRVETKLKGETDFAKNSVPQLKELNHSSLELNSRQESELEDGEIVDDSSDDLELTEQTALFDVRKIIEFKIQKPVRRHSMYFCNAGSSTSSSWCERKFNKSKSCPPRFEVRAFELQLSIAVKDIPLPVGPPPLGSCYNFCKAVEETKASEAKEISEKISEGRVLEIKDEETARELLCGSPFGAIELQKCRNPSPPRSDALGTHRNKIKFTLTKRSRFSKVGLQLEKLKVFEKPKLFETSELKVTVPAENSEQELTTNTVKKADLEVDKTEKKTGLRSNQSIEKPDLEIVEFSKNIHPESIEFEKIQLNIGEKAEMEAVGSTEKLEMNVLKSFEKSELKDVKLSEIVESEAIDPTENLGLEVIESGIIISNETENDTNKIRTPDFVSETVEEISECQIAKVPNTSPILIDEDQKSDLEVGSLCEDANVEIEDVMNDFMRAEFYEDISTSKDLSNGNSVDDEKVNDDKFRSIMQNCLENTKKFLNVGNLKLFSCSVDDLLELDNQEIEPAANHISRDVLLTSCEDANDDLGLNEKFQPVDISMEFVPSDVCPEILPVDNWPYLEEEVPSSPIKSNETDLILENTISGVVPNRKRVAKESENYKRFRRKSLIEDEDKLCSKIAAHRRQTIDGFNSFLSYTKLNGIDKPNESLKCRLSLEKLTKNGVEFICPQDDFPKKVEGTQSKKKLNYKSPLWQPKVMLIRIPENEMKRLKKTKTHSRSADSLPAVKKQKSNHNKNRKCMENDVILSIPPANSIKGQIFSSRDVKKHKPRFRNLHTKRKPEEGQTQPETVETALSELFKEPDENPKNDTSEKTNRNAKIAESELKSESKSDRHSSKYHSHKDKHDHRDRRKCDGGHHRHKEKRKHERSKHDEGKKRRSNNSDDDKKRSLLKSSDSKKETWVCEVCGFDDASERVSHIKNHPFHCQSCHLAFKTEIYFTSHLTEMHKDIRNQHHCLLCELSFDTEEEYQRHLETREHTHLEAVEKNTINTLFTLLTGAPCPVLGVVEMKPEWLPNQPGTVHFYHQATPLSLALQYLKMHRDLTSCSEVSKVHPN